MSLIWYWIVAHGETLLRGALLIGIGLPLVRLIAMLTGRTLRGRLSESAVMLIRKTVSYSLTAVVLVMFLHELGFKLTPLLGAAGIAGVAIGFAAQTSLSNLISGIFLVWERAFQVGDVLQVDDTLGVVHSIDLLAVKLRMFDNRVVRIPNETLVKSKLTNVTHFPIRRFDIDVGVAYKEDVERVARILKEVADKNPHCLDEPEPLIFLKRFGDSALEFLFGVWFEKDDMLKLRTTLMREIKERFDAEGIEIPFPHRTLYTGSETAPFPVRIVGEEGMSPDAQPAVPGRPEQDDVGLDTPPCPTPPGGRTGLTGQPPDYAPDMPRAGKSQA